MHTLAVEHVSKEFKQGDIIVNVLSDISCTFNSTKSYAITGASGSGKSTLLHIIAGLDNPSKGSIAYDGLSFCSLNSDQKLKFLQNTVGLVFQDPFLIEELSVLENVLLKCFIAGTPTQEDIQAALELLERCELADKADAHPLSLSGGQQQRIALARALFNKPTFLLADEPTGNLDERMGDIIIGLLLEYHTRYNMGLIVASHDSRVADAMAEKITLHDGTVRR
jgi:ABC-type lipoprotein export system ATPase subunit